MKIHTLPINALDDPTGAVRDTPGDVVDLAQSIRSTGVIHPVHVVARPAKRYEIVVGHRRVAAARAAGHTDIPCVVHRTLDEQQRVILMLAENVQRADISPIEEARAYQRLRDLGMTQKKIAAEVGSNQPHISKRLALLDLPAADQDAIHRGDVGPATAYEQTRKKRQLDDYLPSLEDPIDVATLGPNVRAGLAADAADGDPWAAAVLDGAQVQGIHQLAKARMRRLARTEVLGDDGRVTKKSLLASNVLRDPDTGAWMGRVLVLLPHMPAGAIREWRRRLYRQIDALQRAVSMANRLLAVMEKQPRAKTPADAARREGTSIDVLLNPEADVA